MLKLKLLKLPTRLHHLPERLGTRDKAGTEHKKGPIVQKCNSTKKVLPLPDQRLFIFK